MVIAPYGGLISEYEAPGRFRSLAFPRITGPRICRSGAGQPFLRRVQRTFEKDWRDHTPKTSRLVRGVGMISMGYVMDELAIRNEARSQRQFENGVKSLVGKTHWPSGEWNFETERRPWHALQNTKAITGSFRTISYA
ncbi:hypothetical protein [Bradyrhizobium sp. CCBAU 45389]|uniref:hypothetical protein n=1 Tax=Bradyrhizobium sp. CCBAU 45389 TaxID=858429 RepID=UPI0023050D45|nr:hypothetical protein [Bradyrhizobium sp. CCBAU 45389]